MDSDKRTGCGLYKYAYRLATALPYSPSLRTRELRLFLFLVCLGLGLPSVSNPVSHRFLVYLFRKRRENAF